MRINFEITFGINREIDEAMARDLIEHVLQKCEPRLHLSIAATIKVNRDLDLRLQRLSLYRSRSHNSSRILKGRAIWQISVIGVFLDPPPQRWIKRTLRL